MNKRNESNVSEVKSGRIEDACRRYGLGKGTMRETAAAAGAIFKVGKCLLINYSIMDAYFDDLSGDK